MSFSFGNTNATPTSNSGSTPAASAPASGGLFGGASTGTPSFSFGNLGSSNTPAAGSSSGTPASSGSLFGQNAGQKPAGGLFGGGTSAASTGTPTSTGGGLFGAKPAAGASSTPAASGGPFGSNTGSSTPSTSAPPQEVSLALLQPRAAPLLHLLVGCLEETRLRQSRQ
ncbi:nuclear pore glycoprotein p62 [Colletotrichum higginsianum]|nr:nuclear pore glycoprotein p62 [Colletotrichum higginsianum]